MNFTYLFIDALKKVVNKCKKTIAQDIFFDQAINQLVDLIKRARLEHDLGIPASYYFRAVPESWDDILAVEVDPDGLVFDSESIRTERITEDADCEGIRVRFNGF